MIYIGADHRGYNQKERLVGELENWGYDFTDLSDRLDKNDDYPEIAIALGEKVEQEKSRGILLCGLGAGVFRMTSFVCKIYKAYQIKKVLK